MEKRINEEWRIYLKELLKSTKNILTVFPISLLFYLVAIPNLQSGEHIQYLSISFMYGFVIFAWIWSLYAILWAVITKIRIQTQSQRVVKLEWPIHIFVGFTGMSGGLLTAKWLKAQILGRPFNFDGILDSLLIGGFISLTFQFYYAYKHSMSENKVLKTAKAESELHVLKNQMQPHFLFNSLNSLAELIECNQSHASIMTQKLSDLYREILENSKHQLTSVHSEISILHKYLELEKLRFGDRLHFTIEEPPSSSLIFIPSLTLQTLVENAVKHGIAPMIDGGEIKIKISKEDIGFKAEIKNTGKLFHSNKTQLKGTGLKNTKARLDLLYGENHRLQIETKNQNTQVSFWFSGELTHV